MRGPSISTDDRPKFWCVIYNQPNFHRFVIGQLNFNSVFLCLSLVTANRQILYYSSILRQDNGIVWYFIGLHQSANVVWLRYPSSRLRNYTRFTDGSHKVCRLNYHLGSAWTGTARNGRAQGRSTFRVFFEIFIYATHTKARLLSIRKRFFPYESAAFLLLRMRDYR